MRKQILGVVLALCMVMGLMSTAVSAEGGTTREVTSGQELTAAIADSADAVVRLTADVELSDTLNISRTVTLDLNGCVLGRSSSGDGPIICVESGGDLTIIDSNPTTEHRFKSFHKTLWTMNENGDRTVSGGIILGDTFYVRNGLFVKEGGRCVMRGGNIVGCYEISNGAGALVQGSFTMAGGNIMGCLAEGRGGGVYVSGGRFTMTGGSIAECGASLDGGGVYLTGPAVMCANGGEVNGTVFIEVHSQITTDAALSGETDFRQSTENAGGTIGYGMFWGSVNNSGTISGGRFGERVDNTKVISGGTFAGTVANKVGSTVSGGTFTGTATVEVVFRYDNGTDPVSIEITRGQRVTEPATPQKTDCFFIGWYDGNTAFDFDEPVWDAVLLQAVWAEITATPLLRINAETNEWEISYDGGTAWFSLGVRATGAAGADGRDGTDGENGADGVTPRIRIGDDQLWYVSYDDGQTWTSLGIRATGDKGDAGDTGAKGDKGDTGAKGDKGEPGADGVTPRVRIGDDQFWYVSYDDGQTWISLGIRATGDQGEAGDTGAKGDKGDAGAKGDKGDPGTDGRDGAAGADGKDGTDGVGIAKAELDADGRLILTFTDGTTVNLGRVVGTDGRDGLSPVIGENGNWWIGEEDTGVRATFGANDSAAPGAVTQTNPVAVAAIAVSGVSLAGNLAWVLYFVIKKKKV